MAKYASCRPGRLDALRTRRHRRPRVPDGGADVDRRGRGRPRGRIRSFPNQTDFRDPDGEPLSRPTIFGAKLAALLLFARLVRRRHARGAAAARLAHDDRHVKDGIILSPPRRRSRFRARLGSVFAALAMLPCTARSCCSRLARGSLAFSGAVRSLMIGRSFCHCRSSAGCPAPQTRVRVRSLVARVDAPAWFVGLERWLDRRRSISQRSLPSPRSAQWVSWSSRWSATCCYTAVSIGCTLKPAVSRKSGCQAITR